MISGETYARGQDDPISLRVRVSVDGRSIIDGTCNRKSFHLATDSSQIDNLELAIAGHGRLRCIHTGWLLLIGVLSWKWHPVCVIVIHLLAGKNNGILWFCRLITNLMSLVIIASALPDCSGTQHAAFTAEVILPLLPDGFERWSHSRDG